MGSYHLNGRQPFHNGMDSSIDKSSFRRQNFQSLRFKWRIK